MHCGFRHGRREDGSWWASHFAAGRHGPFGRGGPRGGPPPWFFDLFGGPPARAERGEVRYLILDALAERPRHGYEIIGTIEERSKGAYRPSPGTIYPTLQLLEELGQVRSAERDGRKIYELTDAGRAELEAHRDDVADAYERLGGGAEWFDAAEIHEVLHRLQRLVRSVARAFRRGSLGARKAREIHRIITEAADRIEHVVNGD